MLLGSIMVCLSHKISDTLLPEVLRDLDEDVLHLFHA